MFESPDFDQPVENIHQLHSKQNVMHLAEQVLDEYVRIQKLPPDERIEPQIRWKAKVKHWEMVREQCNSSKVCEAKAVPVGAP